MIKECYEQLTEINSLILVMRKDAESRNLKLRDNPIYEEILAEELKLREDIEKFQKLKHSLINTKSKDVGSSKDTQAQSQPSKDFKFKYSYLTQ